MTPPVPLDQLGQPIYIDQAHGVTPDPHANLRRDVPVCGSRDVQRSRLWVGPSGTQLMATSMFPTNDLAAMDAASQGRMQDINQALWQQIVGARGDFLYSAQLQSGRFTTLFQPVCREANAASGTGVDERYRLYYADMPELLNPPGSPALQAVPFVFQQGEIVALVNGLAMSPQTYSVDPSNPHTMSIVPDISFNERIRDFINGTGSPIAQDRREAMTEAFENDKYGALKLAQGMRDEMRYTMLGMAALQVVTTAIAMQKGATLWEAASFLPRAIFTPIIEGAVNLFTRRPGNYDWRWTRNFARDVDSRFRYRGLSTVLGAGTNLTELARRGEIRPAVDSGTEVMIERIMNRISTPRRAGSAIVEAPPGWGKEVLMRNLALEHQEIVFIQTQPDDLMSGTMYRGQLETKLRDIPKEIEAALKRGQRVVLCIDEFHEAITAGKSMEETRSLLDRWKGPLANGTLRVVGFSTNDEMLKVRYQAGLYDSPESRTLLNDRQRELIQRWEADPMRYKIQMSENIRPLLNRFRGFEAPVRTDADMRAMLNDELERMRTQDHVQVNIEPRTIELIVRLSESQVSGEGYIPRSAFDLFDGVIADAAETTDMDRPIDIRHDAFENYVRTSWPRVAQRFGMLPTTPAPATAPAPGAPTAAAARPAGPDPTAPRPAAPTPTRSPWQSFYTSSINDRTIEASLRRADPALADYYRSHVSTSAAPVTNLGELLRNMALARPEAINGALSAPSLLGQPLSEANMGRAVFEMIAQAAERDGVRLAGDATTRPRMAATFEAEVRRGRGLEVREEGRAEARGRGRERDRAEPAPRRARGR